MISQTAEYALRAVVWLANHPNAPLTTQHIARATQVPPDYLSKVLLELGRAALVQAQRGKHGGFTLSRPASDISILDVVNAVDPIRRIRSCPLRLGAHSLELCPLHRRLDDALDIIEQAFRGATLADLLTENPAVKPLCEVACA